MFPKSTLDMSLRLPYFGEQYESPPKEARRRSPRYFGGYSVCIVDTEQSNPADIERKFYQCTFCKGLIRSAVQLVPCGHRSCKNCHDFRILINKEKAKSSDEKYCRLCREEDKETEKPKSDNKNRWLFIEFFKDFFFEKNEAKDIIIKHCPINDCTTWTGRTLQDLYKHEKEAHDGLEQQKPPLSEADISQLTLDLKPLEPLSEMGQSSKKKKKKKKKKIQNAPDQPTMGCKETRKETAQPVVTAAMKISEPASLPAKCHKIQGDIRGARPKTVLQKTMILEPKAQSLSPEKTEPLPPTPTAPLTETAVRSSSAIPFVQSLIMGHRSYDVPPEILLLRTQFRGHIINAIKHNPATVTFLGSMALHMHIKRFWDENAIKHIEPDKMPEGIDEELIKLSLVPRDIDLLVASSLSMEAAKNLGAQWMQSAIDNHPYPKAEVLKTADLQLYSPDHITTASVLYLKDGIPAPKNILYAIDLSQKAAAPSNTAIEIEQNIYAKALNEIITDELRCITMLSGGQTRALKAVVRLCALAILETREPKLNISIRTLLSDALSQIPDQDKVISQLVWKLGNDEDSQSVPFVSKTI